MPVPTKRVPRPKAPSPNQLRFETKPCWERWKGRERKSVFAFAEGYKEFISVNKTERLVVSSAQKLAEARGYVSIESAQRGKSSTLRPRKVYALNRNKNIVLAQFGKKPLTAGARMILAHVDSPRLDLKVKPLYEEAGIAFFKTHYYGGIKKYQWPTIPLALYGVVVTKDGATQTIAIGDAPNDPVFTITDLLPHLGKKQMEKILSEAISGEELNLLVGSIPSSEKNEKNKVKLAILTLLHERYGMTEADFVSADLEVVPAGTARDVGFDRSLILGYGHDDRACAYTALQSLLHGKPSDTAQIVFLVDKEEIGSTSNTGATSHFFYDTLGQLLALEAGTPPRSELDGHIRQALNASRAISADVTVAFDPDYRDVFDNNNTAQLGHGVALEKYTGSRGKAMTSEANAEYMAVVRTTFDRANVPWQTGGLGKIDVGGGGTIALFLAEYNMDIVDCGVPVFSMHAPYEVISKADLYAAYLAYSAFLKS